MQQLWAQKQTNKSSLPLEGLRYTVTSSKTPYLHCQPLNEVWEGMDPASSPNSHSGALHATELPWVGPAFHQVLNQWFRP